MIKFNKKFLIFIFLSTSLAANWEDAYLTEIRQARNISFALGIAVALYPRESGCECQRHKTLSKIRDNILAGLSWGAFNYIGALSAGTFIDRMEDGIIGAKFVSRKKFNYDNFIKDSVSCYVAGLAVGFGAKILLSLLLQERKKTEDKSGE